MPRKLIRVSGVVQGIGFRWFVRELAEGMGVAGWVRNLPGGDVELEAQGDDALLRRFLSEVRTGHRWARVEDVAVRDVSEQGGAAGFTIR